MSNDLTDISLQYPLFPWSQFDPQPEITNPKSDELLRYFHHEFKSIYQQQLTDSAVIFIFHDWWFAPYGRDMSINAKSVYEHTDFIQLRYFNSGVLPRYFEQAHKFATNSPFAFTAYIAKPVLFGGQYVIKTAA